MRQFGKNQTNVVLEHKYLKYKNILLWEERLNTAKPEN
jgi:hypothetical protein